MYRTAGVLAARKIMENPYLTCVLPRALSDELILHCVLALSAAHRAHEEDSLDFKSLYSRHYVLALRQLRRELSEAVGANGEEELRFLLAANLLATLEAIGGNTHGAALYHLRASQPFLSAALTASSKSAHRELISFLVESHAYMTLVANITFPSDSVLQDLLTDPLLSSLEQLRSEGTYGVMFGCAHGLFQLIPSIYTLAKTRMQETEHGAVSSDALAQYSYIEQQIRCWRVPSDLQVQGEWFDQLSTAAEIYRHALLIFMHTAFECSPTATEEIMRKLQPEIDAVFPLAQRLFSYESFPPVATIMLWPAIILGSCLRRSEDRRLLRNILLDFPLRMGIVKQAASLLDLLWNDAADDTLFGPMGLYIVMVKNGINFCMA
ncbi:uncharacterized protein Z519_00737 [Cladophialophora bantiana CBS 173.52]|uniref:Uncharacterized protein n=1 Tax=Cladophialophora bantiana (strain ATCC 10958 / CBS 173.52 / CDC B-1940 / NIH 8579) TaxID=1442370 RepID=A0A0D2IQT2_CLAB1|nr:uncharacterized protein Z519_00737 [Cladophialophora bantiana CBS 173.52]KIW99074.1 hypothetical protein Z519_00737 [Cladophialophora bantiana CBS 173.52]